MADWGALLDQLASGPREDGTPELAAAAGWLYQELQRRGLTPERVEWLAHPWRLRLVGVVALLGAAAYVAAMLKRRHGVALLVTLAVPAYLVAELDYGVPLLGAIHSVPQQHVVATIPAAQSPPRQRLIFSAHYDTKTDLLDHVERAPLQLLALPLTLLMLVAAVLRRPRLTRVAIAGAVVNGLGLFAVQTGGAFVPARSHGVLDDAAGCAVLLELGSQLKLEHTEVKLVFFSGEEIGIEGSKQFVKTLDRSLPLRVINLDGVGISSQLALFKSESGVVRSFPPDPALAAAIEQVTPLFRAWYPATTDARAFLEAGIPALNLASVPSDHSLTRGLHSRFDTRGRVSNEALDATLSTLLEVARRLDTGR